MSEAIHPEGPDLSRREFVKTLGAAALASSALPAGRATASAPAETAVARFYRSLKDDQKAQICFPSDHPLRWLVNNNWAVVKPSIADLAADQKALCKEVFKNLCSDDGHARFLRQMDEDYGGFENYHVAVFGTPGTDTPFEWVVTGRHVTLRADGHRDSVASLAGPIFYGHASQRLREDARHAGNVWWYQAERANAIFQTLNKGQQVRALVPKAEPDSPRPPRLRGPDLGLSVGTLDASQKAMVQALLKDLLRPFRSVDAEEIQSCLREPGDVDPLCLTYYQEGDIGPDGVWDIWKLDGPAFSWYFHGSPHVHVWLNVARPAPAV